MKTPDPKTPFLIERKDSVFQTHFVLTGPISEESAFPPYVASPGVKEVAIDLAGVNFINSWGVRLWVKWIWSVSESLAVGTLFLDRCTAVVVKQMLIVQKFIPPNVTVRSVFIPYFCDACGEAQKYLLRADDSSMRAVLSAPEGAEHETTCVNCGAQAAIDIIPEPYLRAFR